LERKLVKEWLFAAERGDLPSLTRQLAAEPRLVDALGPGPYWEGDARALHFACSRGHFRVVRWLLDRGSSPNPIRRDGDWSPLHFAAGPAKRNPAKRNIVRLLLARGARMDIFSATALGDVAGVRKFLRRDRKLVSAHGPDGATPLHFAGSAAVARVLLEAGADPASRDRFHDQTPAEWAIGRPGVMRELIRAGAEVDVFLASAMGSLARVKDCLRVNPALARARFPKAKATLAARGETPLSIATGRGHRKVVEYLLNHGARATEGPSPLPGAVHSQDLALVRRLVAAGADPNAFGPRGHAALHAACVYGRLPMIRYLLAKGARLDLRDQCFQATPLDWAEHHNLGRAVAFLKSLGTALRVPPRPPR
jgi:ankyrin repeat protein